MITTPTTPLAPKVVLRAKSDSATPPERATVQELATALGLKPITTEIMVNRGIRTVEEARQFLAPTLRHSLPNPVGIKNIELAADLILTAVEENQQIVLFTDFDVDGLTAGAQLYLFLSALGARVMHYTPNRFTEGYGLSRGPVEKFIQAKIDLLVTIDCGISNVQEIDLAKRHGVSTVIIDHHIPHDLPPADAIVNPAQEGCSFQEHKLCAAGLVWMVLIVLRQRALVRWGEPKTPLPDPKTYLDLAALGTICDMVPLVGLNRVLAYRGIEALQASARPGLSALREVCGLSPKKKLTAGHTSFLLGPRINAAGRLEDGRLAFELLTTTNELKAKALAKRIDELNTERRTVEESVKQSCLKQLKGDPVATAQPALAVFGESFHAGVIGIVAQRLVEEFHRPAAVMAPGEAVIQGERKPVIKGSVRSISGFHVAEALESLSALLVSHGGHREAGGFTVLRENLEAFQRGFIAAAGERLTEEHLARTVYADAEVTLGEIDYALVDELVKLSPFGVGNPSPVLITRGLSLEAVTPFGENSVRLRFSDGKHFADGVLWRARSFERLRRGERVNIAYHPEISSYQGLSSVQLNIKELW